VQLGGPAGRLFFAAVAAYVAVGFARPTEVPVAGDVPAAPVPSIEVDRRPPIVVAVSTPRPVVALTFDDGPDPRWTPPVLEALRRHGARATFFVTGEAVRAHPELLRQVVEAGHEVANHTDTHPRMDGLDAPSVAAEVEAASMAIGAAGVNQAPFFRPPRGRYGADVLAGVAATGLRPVGWTVCLERSLRHAGPDGAVVAARTVRPGGIVLAHDGGIPDRTATVQALPAMLDALAGRGLEVVSLSELLALGPEVAGRPGVDPRAAPLARAGWR
jgi:peptidoglycan/xylan/chitin deacetylase (PgdA/CDA1 family)